MRLMRTASLTLGLVLLASACASTTNTADPAGPEANSELVADTAPGADPAQTDQIGSTDVENVPSALNSMTDDAFPPPLVDPNEIISGGPPPDGIPPLDDPFFEPADAVNWLEPNEPVLSIEIDGEARAYPIQIMTWHEIVNDTIGDTPVTVSYCPLCNSAVAYDRRLGERILDFGTSGMLFNSSLVMYDRQTQSLWTHFDGAAVVGFLTGETLDTFPVATVSWADFVEAYPDGLVLSRATGFERDYGRNPYTGYDNPDGDPFLFNGERDDRLPPQTRVVAIRGTNETVAIEQEPLVEAGVQTATLDGIELVVFASPGTNSALDSSRIVNGKDVGSTGVFESTVDGQSLTFTRTADERWTDDQTGTEWNLFGLGVDGELAGSQLTAIPHLNTFWFAIAAFEPDTLVLAS